MHRSAILLVLLPFAAAVAQNAARFTHADTLRGAETPQRVWWDATFYDLHVAVNPADSSVRGWNGISYRVVGPAQEMQIDLQQPLEVDSIVQRGRRLTYRRDGNAFFAKVTAPQQVGNHYTVTVYYHGKPVVARRPPWDGGFIWQHDGRGNRWVATANEAIGASAWWPNKDLLADEPDSQRIAITVPSTMTEVSNGRLRSSVHHANGTITFEWFVTAPINTYDVAVNAGHYAHFADVFDGELGELTMDYWPLTHHLEAAQLQFRQAAPMMACFEHWFGPFPWYADGYKLVEAPHLGMEHQSAIAYGNNYRNGYAGRDLSVTERGLLWDFIIVHESAHEWWGNSITVKDAADMWVHEGFASYAENLYTECQQGRKAGAEYVRGTRRLVKNDVPVVGHYGVHDEGSADKYYKGSNLLHMIRALVNDDDRWRQILRGLNREFWHRTVTGAQVEAYISAQAGQDFRKVFEQYLTTTRIPVLQFRIEGSSLAFRWANVVRGFDMPVRVTLSTDEYTLVRPTEEWQTMPTILKNPDAFRVDADFFVDARHVGVAIPAQSSR